MEPPDGPATRELGAWTPVAFHPAAEARLEWADLSGRRFRGLFRREVEAWRAEPGAATRITGLEALAELDEAPALDPVVIVAHASRCGSTLLARQLGAPQSAVLALEPPIGRFMEHAAANPAFDPDSKHLRQLVRAFGRIRFGDESRFVVKLSSSCTPFLPQLRRAFPHAAFIWLQRRPTEIVSSQMRSPSRWMDTAAGRPEALRRVVLRKLAVVFLAARAHVDDAVRVLDYADLAGDALACVARSAGFEFTAEERRDIADIARYHARTGEPFEPRAPDPLDEEMAMLVAEALDPHYRALDRRRRTPAAA